MRRCEQRIGIEQFIEQHQSALDVAFSLEQNQYNGETYTELTIADFRVQNSD